MKAFSIIVGVDRLNCDHYGYSESTDYAFNSARLVFDFLKGNTSIEVTEDDVFVNERATFNDLKYRFQYYSKRSQNEPIYLMVYMGGHGERKKNEDLAFLKLYDQMLFENEFKNWLKDFHEDSKLFCVIDSCYSGAFVKDKQLVYDDDFGLINKGNKSFSEFVNLYHEKLEIKLSLKPYPETFIISSIDGLNYARIYFEKKLLLFTYHFIDQLKLSSSIASNYLDFFGQLKEAMIAATQTRRTRGQIPKEFHFQHNKGYFANHKPFKF